MCVCNLGRVVRISLNYFCIEKTQQKKILGDAGAVAAEEFKCNTTPCVVCTYTRTYTYTHLHTHALIYIHTQTYAHTQALTYT